MPALTSQFEEVKLHFSSDSTTTHVSDDYKLHESLWLEFLGLEAVRFSFGFV